ncbi:hypothetical protein EVAR_41478_1 [Eumeta japonica]|uniref:Uncharacterized protein n=1 Tax=Eumeta variegata TaxID=151549 RepID=A0A4C1X1L1_EUMVA|nr:hypothetical protein EVAR_41478_1 [Eumeta japonica]
MNISGSGEASALQGSNPRTSIIPPQAMGRVRAAHFGIPQSLPERRSNRSSAPLAVSIEKFGNLGADTSLHKQIHHGVHHTVADKQTNGRAHASADCSLARRGVGRGKSEQKLYRLTNMKLPILAFNA